MIAAAPTPPVLPDAAPPISPDPAPDPAGFGVYVHWPFCKAKCPYCDFNSHVRHAPPDEKRFIAAFRREIAHMRDLSGPKQAQTCLLYTSPSPRDLSTSRMPSSA